MQALPTGSIRQAGAPWRIELIEVGIDQLDALAGSVTGLLDDEGGAPPDPTTLRVALLARLRRGRRAVLFRLAEPRPADAGEQAAPCGHALWHPLSDRIRIEQFRIAPEQRRRGLGSACLGALVDAHGLAALPLEVRVLADNPAAIAFWSNQGFQRRNGGDDPGGRRRSMCVLPRSPHGEGDPNG